jgi:hypothetical protein
VTPARHEQGVLDTSAVIRLGETNSDRLAGESVITTVTLAELTVGPSWPGASSSAQRGNGTSNRPSRTSAIRSRSTPRLRARSARLPPHSERLGANPPPGHSTR